MSISLHKKNTIIFSAVYLLFVLLLQLINGWYQNFSDAPHYLWVADQYSGGNFGQAVNTYWGPMISWILALTKPIIAAPFIRFRIVQVIIGALVIRKLYDVLRLIVKEDRKALLFVLVNIPLIAAYAWYYLTPDLLLLLVALVCIKQLLEPEEISFRKALKLAFTGACMFFVKSVGLYFFILLIAGKFIFEKKQWNPKHLKFNATIALLLVLFCLPWVYLISEKNGSFTMGTGSAHNYKLNSPRITPDIYGELGNPYHLGTLTEPKPSTAYDASIESMHQPYLSWEGMSDKEIRAHYIKVIIKNLKSARSMFFGLDIGTVLLLMMAFAFFRSRKELFAVLNEYKVLWILFLANVLLYLPFFFMNRYTWVGTAALFLLLVALISNLSAVNKKTMQWFVLVITLVLNTWNLYGEYTYALPERPVTEAIWSTKGTIPLKRTIWLCEKSDPRLGLVKGLIYYNKGQYLGSLFYDQSSAVEIKTEIKKFSITEVVCVDQKAMELISANFSAVVLFRSEAFTIFRIEPNSPKP